MSTAIRSDSDSAIISDTNSVREAVGVFMDVNSLYDCIDELQTHGFDRSDLTMLDHLHIKEGPILDYGSDIKSAEDNPTIKRGAIVEPESIGDAEGALIGLPLYIFTMIGAGVSAAFGAPIATIIAIAAGAGLIGALIGGGGAYWLKSRKDAYYKEQLLHGGIPLWVHTKDPEHEAQAMRTLKENNAEDVHIHDLSGTPYEVREGRTTIFHIIH